MSKVKLGDVAEEVKETYDGKGNPAIVGLEHLVPGDIRLKSWSTDTDNTIRTSSSLLKKGCCGTSRWYLLWRYYCDQRQAG